MFCVEILTLTVYRSKFCRSTFGKIRCQSFCLTVGLIDHLPVSIFVVIYEHILP